MRILLVEDEESLRITLSANLELEGYEVVEACDGAEALALLESRSFDLVLSDVRMPRVTGVTLLQRIKERWPALPVLLMTAYTAEEQLERAVDGGVFAVLRKPFAMDAALTTIVRALRGPTVLVVDSEETDTAAFVAALGKVGLRVTLAGDTSEVTHALDRLAVDVCVADVAQRDGVATSRLELIRSLRDNHPHVTVIVVADSAQSESVMAASRLGVFACLQRPVTSRQLLKAIAQARGGGAIA